MGVAVWGSCVVGLLRCVTVAMYENGIVRSLAIGLLGGNSKILSVAPFVFSYTIN